MSENEPEIRVTASDALEFEPISIKTSKIGQRVRTVFLVFVAIALGAVGWELSEEHIRTFFDGKTKEIPFIKADFDQVKRRPDNPGGLKVPDRKKLVYSDIHKSAGGQSFEAPVERLLPLPEQPLIKKFAELQTEGIKGDTENIISSKFPMPPKKLKYIGKTPTSTDVKNAEKPVAPPIIPQLADGNIATFPADKAPIRLEKKEVGLAEVKPPVNLGTNLRSLPINKSFQENDKFFPQNSFRVQLAATRSVKSARVVWEKIKKRNVDILNDLNMKVVKTDLGKTKGVFYRVRIGPFSGKVDAQNLCTALVKRKEGCLVIRPGR